MKILEERKLSMYEVTRDLLMATDSDIMNLMPLIENYRTSLANNINSISNFGGTQKLNRKGFSDDKVVLRNILITKATDVSRKVQAYATNVQNLVLLKEVKYNDSTLKRLPDNILVITAKIIYNHAKEITADLENYSITDSILIDLKKAIDNYEAAIPKPRTGIIDKKNATLNLKQLFSNTDDLLKNHIDVLVGIVKDAYPQYYNKYFDSRKIINSAKHSLAISCVVVDENSNPLADVTALVKETSNLFHTKTKGGFNVKSFAQGSYHFIFSKEGYVSQTIVVAVNNGERTNLKVTLIANTQ